MPGACMWLAGMVRISSSESIMSIGVAMHPHLHLCISPVQYLPVVRKLWCKYYVTHDKFWALMEPSWDLKISKYYAVSYACIHAANTLYKQCTCCLLWQVHTRMVQSYMIGTSATAPPMYMHVGGAGARLCCIHALY